MALDAIFNGPPTDLTPNSGSGVASLGLDVTAGQLYFRTPNTGWQETAGGSGGGSTSDDITNESGLAGATVTDALNTLAPTAATITLTDAANDTLSLSAGSVTLSAQGSGGLNFTGGGLTIEDATNDAITLSAGSVSFSDQGGDDAELTEGVFILSCAIATGQFAVASLPASPQEGYIAYATNGRKVGEGAGSGTGVPVYFSNGAWRVFSTDQPVSA
jgi:hypothetical protein